jgi:hypothetical protein
MEACNPPWSNRKAGGGPRQCPSGPYALFLKRTLGFQDTPFRTYGWLQNSFTGNANGTPRERSNFSVFPNRHTNQFRRATLADLGDVYVFPLVSLTRIRQILGMMQADKPLGIAERCGRGRGVPTCLGSERDEGNTSRTLDAMDAALRTRLQARVSRATGSDSGAASVYFADSAVWPLAVADTVSSSSGGDHRSGRSSARRSYGWLGSRLSTSLRYGRRTCWCSREPPGAVRGNPWESAVPACRP